MNNFLLAAMNNFMMLMGSGESTTSDRWDDIISPIVDTVHAILLPLMIVVLTAGVIYAVVLGVNMARAEDAGQRDEAKKKVINVIIAIVITAALIFVLELVVDYIQANGTNIFG